MSQTFAVNSNNDLYLDNNGNIAIATGVDAVSFDCQFAAKTQLGEMVLFTNQGIPNFQVVWVGSPNIAQFEAALRIAILNVPGVVDILNLSISFNDNILSYEITILTIYGEAYLNGRL